MILFTLFTAVLGGYHIHYMLTGGDWDFWTDWKDRRLWVTVHQPIFEEYRHKSAKCKINAFFATAKTFQKRVLLGDYRLIGILTSRIRMSADNDTKNVRPTLST